MQKRIFFNSFESNPLALLALLLCVLALTVLASSTLTAWTASLWVIDYPEEFVKRGVVGQILWAFLGDKTASLSLVSALATTVLLAVSFVFSVSAIAIYRTKPLMLAGLLLASFSLQQWAYDVGRFDQINYILLFVGLCVVCCIQNKVLAFCLLLFLTALMFVVHEASALLHVPVLVAALVIRNRQGLIPSRWVVGYFFSAVVLFVLVVALGGLDTQSYLAWYAKMQQKNLGFQLDDNALQVLKLSLADNVAMTVERLLSEKTASRFFRVILLALPTGFIMVAIMRHIKQKDSYSAAAVMLPVLAVLPLFLLGIDFYRWFASLQLNFFIVTSFYFFIHPDSFRTLAINPKALWLLILFSVYMGPVGISVAMPERLLLIESVSQLF